MATQTSMTISRDMSLLFTEYRGATWIALIRCDIFEALEKFRRMQVDFWNNVPGVRPGHVEIGRALDQVAGGIVLSHTSIDEALGFFDGLLTVDRLPKQPDRNVYPAVTPALDGNIPETLVTVNGPVEADRYIDRGVRLFTAGETPWKSGMSVLFPQTTVKAVVAW